MSMTFHGVEYPLRLFGPGTLSVAPPHILPTLKLFAFGACWRVSLDSVPPLLRNFPNIGLIPVLFLLQEQSTALYMLLCRKLTPSQTDPV